MDFLNGSKIYKYQSISTLKHFLDHCSFKQIIFLLYLKFVHLVNFFFTTTKHCSLENVMLTCGFCIANSYFRLQLCECYTEIQLFD